MKTTYLTFWILLAITSTSCAAKECLPMHLISDLIKNPELYDGEKVYLVVCHERNIFGAIHIFPCDDIHRGQDSYIDAVGSSEVEEAIGKRQRINIGGKFRAYNGSLVGTGFLTSKVGLLEIYLVDSKEP